MRRGLANAPDRYGLVAVTLHWLIALAILANVLLGWIMEDLGTSAFVAFQVHKSIGLTVLALSLLRLAWRLVQPPPPLPARLRLWERAGAQLTHWGFYGLMIGLPLTGWALVSSTTFAFETRWFFLFIWPDLPLPRDDGLAESFESVHGALVWIALALLALHVGAALKHHFLDRDDVLARMLPLVRPPGEQANSTGADRTGEGGGDSAGAAEGGGDGGGGGD